VNYVLKHLKPRVPTPLQIAVEQLEDSQRQKLEQSKLREYHYAMEEMLSHRIARLRQEIYELTQEQGA
jgi:hypothetical protein